MIPLAEILNMGPWFWNFTLQGFYKIDVNNKCHKFQNMLCKISGKGKD